MRQNDIQVRTITVRFRSDEIADFFFDLRQQPTFPIVQGDPLLLLYDLLCTMNISEKLIADWVRLWQTDTLRLLPVLAGQYVRVEFSVDTGSSEPHIGGSSGAGGRS